VLLDAIGVLSDRYPRGTATYMLHPKAYADAHGIAYDKTYTLGVLDLDYLAPYLSYIEGLISPETRCDPKATAAAPRR
jgi:hypothetical protein